MTAGALLRVRTSRQARELDALTPSVESWVEDWPAEVYRVALCDLEREEDGRPRTLVFEVVRGRERGVLPLVQVWTYDVARGRAALLAVTYAAGGRVVRDPGAELARWMHGHARRALRAILRKGAPSP